MRHKLQAPTNCIMCPPFYNKTILPSFILFHSLGSVQLYKYIYIYIYIYNTYVIKCDAATVG